MTSRALLARLPAAAGRENLEAVAEAELLGEGLAQILIVVDNEKPGGIRHIDNQLLRKRRRNSLARLVL